MTDRNPNPPEAAVNLVLRRFIHEHKATGGGAVQSVALANDWLLFLERHTHARQT